jgi:hypothetical protein
MPRLGSRCTLGADSLVTLQGVKLVDVATVRVREAVFTAGPAGAVETGEGFLGERGSDRLVLIAYIEPIVLSFAPCKIGYAPVRLT